MQITETLTCAGCGIGFSVPVAWLSARRADCADFYCPNGHKMNYKLSLADRLLAEKRALEQTMQAQLNKANHLRLVAEKAFEAERRKRRKIEKRIAAGVCPCCNRTFQDLHRHMTTKHKEYALPPASKAIESAKKSVQ